MAQFIAKDIPLLLSPLKLGTLSVVRKALATSPAGDLSPMGVSSKTRSKLFDITFFKRYYGPIL